MHWDGTLNASSVAAVLTLVGAGLAALWRHDRRAERLSYQVGQLADELRALALCLRTYTERTDLVLHQLDTRVALLESDRRVREKGN